MSRQHFQRETSAGSLRALAPKVKEEGERVEGKPLARVNFGLTADLIYGFQQEYLHENYDPPLETPPFHKEMWGVAANEDYPHALFLAPRGHAKSTSITEAYGLCALLFRQRDFAVIISNTYSQSVEFLEDVRKHLLENTALKADFGIKKLIKDREDDIVVLMDDGHKFRMIARGSGQPVRGLKWHGRRPNLILLDDLEDDAEVESDISRKKFKRWFMRQVLPFGSDDCLFRMAATILHFDSLAENLAKDPDWKTLRYKAHRSYSDFSDILWPEKFSEARLRRIRNKYIRAGDEDGYSQEYLNNPIAEGKGLFREEDLLPMDKADREVAKRYYCAWDLAISEKQTADYTVCVVVGVDHRGMFYVVDVRRSRWDSKGIIDEMFSVYLAWKPEVFWVEKDKIEKAIGPFLYDAMHQREVFFNVETEAPVSDKVTRSASWRAKTRARGVKYDQEASWWDELKTEMLRFPKGEHDDQVDSQSLLGLKLLDVGSANSPAEQAEEEYNLKFGRQANHQNRGVNATTGY